jgi:DNA polymerase eta
LWKELVGTSLVMNVTSVQLAFTGIEPAESGQRSIEGFLKAGQTTKRQRDDDDFPLGSFGDPSAEHKDELDTTIARGKKSSTSFTCTRCGKTIPLPFELADVVDLYDEAIIALRSEHNDFHFAQDLAKESSDVLVISGPSKGSPKKKKRRGEPQGIEKFFGRT